MSKGGGVLEVELEAVRLSLLIPLSSICACLHRSRTISAPHDLGAFPDFPPPSVTSFMTPLFSFFIFLLLFLLFFFK